MPGFNFISSHYGINQSIREERYRKYRDFVDPILKNFPKKLQQLATNENDFNFALSLYVYLKKIDSEFRETYAEDRFQYVKDLVDALLSNDIDKQFDMVAEEKINPFQGFFSQRLYDLLSQRRTFLEQHSQSISAARCA